MIQSSRMREITSLPFKYKMAAMVTFALKKTRVLVVIKLLCWSLSIDSEKQGIPKFIYFLL